MFHWVPLSGTLSSTVTVQTIVKTLTPAVRLSIVRTMTCDTKREAESSQVLHCYLRPYSALHQEKAPFSQEVWDKCRGKTLLYSPPQNYMSRLSMLQMIPTAKLGWRLARATAQGRMTISCSKDGSGGNDKVRKLSTTLSSSFMSLHHLLLPWQTQL